MLLLASTSVTGAQTTVYPGVRVDRSTYSAEFQLAVTAAAAAAGDTLDVYVQTSADNTNWDDLIHFTKVLGNGGAKVFLARWSVNVAPTVSTTAAPQDGVIAAAAIVQGAKAALWRVKIVVVQASAAAFTFSVLAGGARRQS